MFTEDQIVVGSKFEFTTRLGRNKSIIINAITDNNSVEYTHIDGLTVQNKLRLPMAVMLTTLNRFPECKKVN